MARAQRTFELGGESIAAGERRVVQMPVASLYNSREPMHLPVHVVVGKRPGPTLLVSAAMHGDELNGVEIIRRLMNQRALGSLRGVLITVPIVNIFGIIQQSRLLPDGRDLNRSFPGSSRGSLASRLASIFLTEIVGRSDVCIDLHTGAQHRTNLPQIRGNLDNESTLELAQAFGVPVLLNAATREGSLRDACADSGPNVLVYEAGEALRFDEVAIRAGVTGVLRVMRKMRMLRRSSAGPQQEPYVAQSSQWVRAPASGVFQSSVGLGERVRTGDTLAAVTDPTDFFGLEPDLVRAEFAGIVIGKTMLPLVNEGDALFHIARFEEDVREVANEVESFQQSHEP